MIYKKEANFPYPILSINSTSYDESSFTFSLEFEELDEYYRFHVKDECSSEFLSRLLSEEKAQYILVIQSKDTKFYPLTRGQKQVDVPKKRLSLSNRTSIQLHIAAADEIDFKDNSELSSFYDEMRASIEVPKYSMLAFSNIVTFEGGMRNPSELFEKKLNPHLESAIKYEIGSESIIIHFKDEATQFQSAAKANAFLNPYLYTGLAIALRQFIDNYADPNEAYVDLTNISPPEQLLHFKLYNLMTKKAVNEITYETIDEVIAKISNKMIEKYVQAVKELSEVED